jgi:catechol 2,3-dioxygenase-like lactoylglutathione lyase family enzyme
MYLDHIAIQVSDLERAIRFYQDLFGLRLMFKQRDETHHEAFAFLELEGGNLELLQVLDEENRPVPFARPEAKPPFTPHIALRSEDLADSEKDLKDKGVCILKGPLEIPGQVKWLYFSDPDGNVIELVEWI